MTRMNVRYPALLVAAAAIATSVSCSDNSSGLKSGTINKVNHVVVIYLENRGFDNTYGEFAGATGLADAASALPQLDSAGNAYDTLPEVAGQPYPTNLPNAPFDIALYVPPTVATRDLVHRFYQEQVQIDGGKMDKFVNKDVLETLLWLLRQFRIEPDPARVGIAASPLRLHLLNGEVFRVDTKDRRPSGQGVR